jgi:glycosyltransferase involved in cell wall biosynthesis
LENYSIKAADARLCPSNYYARQAEAHFGLEKDSITVMPLPIGDFPVLERSEEVWRKGTICYVGRLEPRKGVIEWVDAAVLVAREHPSVQFELIGADLPYTQNISVKQFVKKRIPDAVKSRFHFRGSRPRVELLQFLALARAAVIPSRWENFPNTCIEALSSGLPVIATRNGGMADMIEDGRTGWLAEECSSASLEFALRRALKTKPKDLAKMGRVASESIRHLCNNAEILKRHIQFRRSIADGSASCSLHLPTNLRWTGRRDMSGPESCSSRTAPENGVAVIVTCRDHGAGLDDCLRSIRRQTHSPVATVLVVDDKQNDETRPAVDRARIDGWEVCELRNGKLSAMKNAGISSVIAAGRNPAAFVFLDSMDRLFPNFVEACESVIKRCPDVGVVSSWTQIVGGDERFFANLCPAFPYQLISNEAAPTAAIRTKALHEAELFRELIYDGYEDWDLINAVMANGWAAVTFPALLSERIAGHHAASILSTFPGHRRMREQLLARIPEVIEHYAQVLMLILESRIFQMRSFAERDHASKQIDWYERILRPRDILHLSFSQQITLAGKALRHPSQATKFFLWHARRALDRYL